MTRAIAIGGLIVALGSPALAAAPDQRIVSVDTQEPAATAEPVADTTTPPMIRDALVGVRLLHLHQGRDGLDPAAAARQHSTAEAGR